MSGHLAGTQPDATLDISKPLPVATGYGFHASANQGRQPALTGSIQGQTQFGQAEAFVTSLDKDVHSQLSVAGGSRSFLGPVSFSPDRFKRATP